MPLLLVAMPLLPVAFLLLKKDGGSRPNTSTESHQKPRGLGVSRVLGANLVCNLYLYSPNSKAKIPTQPDQT